tara:strand:+ start:2021 stop:2359 length:339 start_codon:yes stop_codon:yes gene_type:complete
MSTELDKEMGIRVRKLRKLKKITLQEMGDKVGLTHGMLGHLERGERGWRVEHIHSIAEVLDVPPSLLQDTSIPLDRVEMIASVLEHLATLSPERAETVVQMMELLAKENKSQ